MRPFRRAARAAIVAAAAGLAACPGRVDDARPNVLVLVMDTTRADRCVHLGYDRPTTPELAAFARESVAWEDCWAPSSWTAPSHASLFTGLHPSRHNLHRDGTTVLQSDYDTLAEVLGAAGWATASWSNNPYISPKFGLTQGFQTFEVLADLPGRTYPWARDTHERALAWMEERTKEGRPFFAFVNDLEPHYPYRPPRDVEARFVRPGVPAAAVESIRDLAFPRQLGLSLGAEPWEPGEREALSDLYDAELATLDAEVGVLISRMRSSGILDRTIVVIAADHGEGLGDHAWIEHGIKMYRELLRVPLVVRYPGRFDGGRRVKDVARLEDVFPTVLATCGLPVPAGLDGADLATAPTGRDAKSESGVYFEWADTALRSYPNADVAFMRTNRRSIYDGRWHLIVDGFGATELFDVAADPGELRNVAADQPAVVEALRARLDRR